MTAARALRRPSGRTYANVMSTIAVFLLVAGGSAYAGAKFGAGDIKPNAVRSKHIKAKAVKSADLGPGTPTDVITVREDTGLTSGDKELEVACPGGRLPIGGGATNTSGGSSFVAFQNSSPVYVADGFNVNGWFARAIEVNGGTPQSWAIRIYLICARGVKPLPD